MADELVS